MKYRSARLRGSQPPATRRSGTARNRRPSSNRQHGQHGWRCRAGKVLVVPEIENPVERQVPHHGQCAEHQTQRTVTPPDSRDQPPTTTNRVMAIASNKAYGVFDPPDYAWKTRTEIGRASARSIEAAFTSAFSSPVRLSNGRRTPPPAWPISSCRISAAPAAVGRRVV